MDTTKQALAVTATGKRILAELLGLYVQEHIGSSRIPYTELAEAMQLQDILESNAMTDSKYVVVTATNTGSTPAGDTYVVANITAMPAGLRVQIKKELRSTLEQDQIDARVLDTQQMDDVFVHWEELDNVELLSDVFKAQRVDVFRQLVQSLGRLHRMQDTVKALIAQGDDILIQR